MTKDEVITQLQSVRGKVVNLRDDQDVILCEEYGACICHDFDKVLDCIDDLYKKFEGVK